MKKTLEELEEEMDHAYMMASIGRDPAWLPIMDELDRQIQEMKNDSVP